MALIEVHDLRKGYAMGDLRTEVLRGVELAVEPGEFVTLYGPSGSGKTTLLNIIAGVDAADAGTVHVDGLEVTAANQRALTEYRRDNVGYIFQFYNLIPTLTALENVSLALELGGVRDGARSQEALAQVGLGDKGHRFPAQLSGGEQQRVAIARALVKRPTVVAGDEPTGNLDAETSRDIIDLLHRLNEDHGLTILLATHDPELAGRGARVMELRDGVLHHLHGALPYNHSKNNHLEEVRRGADAGEGQARRGAPS